MGIIGNLRNRLYVKVSYQKAKVIVYGRLFVADLSLPLGQGLLAEKVAARRRSRRTISTGGFGRLDIQGLLKGRTSGVDEIMTVSRMSGKITAEGGA